MANKSMTITVEAPRKRNAMVEAMVQRFGGGHRIMKDRRAPKGGARNKQRDYREGSY